MKNITEFFLRIFMMAVVCGVLFMVILAAQGCGRRETEFLEAAGQTETVAENGDSYAAAGTGEKKQNPEGEDRKSGENNQQPEGKDQKPGENTHPGNREDSDEPVISEEQMPSEEEESILPVKIFVDVCGAVTEPGVYELDEDSRVFQAIEAAGGFLPEAAGEYVNRAGKLMDGQQIYIPTREETENDPSFQSPLEKSLSNEGRKESSADGTGVEDSGKVNLNTADENALTTLTGIGASKAQAILAYREEHGGFSAIEEILNVPGIKEGTFVKIKDNIAVE